MTRRMPHFHAYKSINSFIGDEAARNTGKETCLRAWRQCSCGAGHWVKKRRPKNKSPEDCLWPWTWCADHPDKRIKTRAELRAEFFEGIRHEMEQEEEGATQDRPGTVS